MSTRFSQCKIFDIVELLLLTYLTSLHARPMVMMMMMMMKLDRGTLPAGITLSGVNFDHEVTSNGLSTMGYVPSLNGRQRQGRERCN